MKTVNDVMVEWADHHSFFVKDSTMLIYQNCIKRIGDNIPEFYNQDIEKVSQLDIQNIFIKLSKTYATNSLWNFSKVLNMTFVYAQKNKYISQNPYYDITIPKKERDEIHPFTKSEVERILEVPMPQWMQDAIEIAFLTGLRKGELFALRKCDIDFNNKFLMIRKTQSIGADGKIVITSTKTKTSCRRVDLNDRSFEILKRRAENSIGDFIFSRNGKMIVPYNITNTIKRKCKLAEIPPHTFHDLRHGHATFLLSKGVHPKIVQERLGHASCTITLDTYSHMVPGMQKSAIKALDELI